MLVFLHCIGNIQGLARKSQSLVLLRVLSGFKQVSLVAVVMEKTRSVVQFFQRFHVRILIIITLAVSANISANDDLKDIAIKFRDATSFYLLAQKYSIGGGTNRDYQEAIKWYTEAAKLGHVKSELQLGRFYFEGLGTDVDYDQAARWLNNPARKGYNDAQYMLGMIYLKGTKGAIKKDESKAFEWLKKSADDFNTDAIYQVGRMYYYGIGTSKNVDKAKHYLKLAEEQEIEKASQLLAQIRQDEQTPEAPAVVVQEKSASELRMEAATAGNADAQFKLAKSYLEGAAGQKKNPAKGLEWLGKAAANGQKDAQYMLGSMYYNGKLVKRNFDQASFWLKKPVSTKSPANWIHQRPVFNRRGTR
ncbi:MAG: hypothetical protein AMJ55_12005 [Gammaproteobacteria bacterium SG8_15]|nr:MAG: hypothetical protein AMJ55_12005 [Gammaproteobacteria bacterium SG8_15]